MPDNTALAWVTFFLSVMAGAAVVIYPEIWFAKLLFFVAFVGLMATLLWRFAPSFPVPHFSRGYGSSRASRYLPIEDAARLSFEKTGIYSDWTLLGETRLKHHVILMLIEARENPRRLSVWGVQLPSKNRFARVPLDLLQARNLHGSDIQVERPDGSWHSEWTRVSVLNSELPAYIERLKRLGTAGQRIVAVGPKAGDVATRH